MDSKLEMYKKKKGFFSLKDKTKLFVSNMRRSNIFNQTIKSSRSFNRSITDKTKSNRTFNWVREQEALRSNNDEHLMESVKFLTDNNFEKKRAKLKNWETENAYNRIQWVYPEFAQRPSVRRNHAKRGLIIHSHSNAHKLPIKKERTSPKSQTRPRVKSPSRDKTETEEREPYRPVLIIKNNKVITKYRAPVKRSGISPPEPSLKVRNQTKNDLRKGTTLLETSIKHSMKRETPKEKKNIFSAFNSIFSSNKRSIDDIYMYAERAPNNLTLGTDIVGVLNKRRLGEVGRNPEMQLNYKNHNRLVGFDKISTHKVAGIEVHHVKGRNNSLSALDKRTLHQINKLQNYTIEDQNHGIYKVSNRIKKSSLKYKNNRFDDKSNRKLSWDQSVQDKAAKQRLTLQDPSDEGIQLRKTKSDPKLNQFSPHNKIRKTCLIDIGKVYLGSPNEDLTAEDRPKVEDHDDNELDAKVKSKSIGSVSSIDESVTDLLLAEKEIMKDECRLMREIPKKYEEIPIFSNRPKTFEEDFDGDIGTKIISDTLSEIVDEAVKAVRSNRFNRFKNFGIQIIEEPPETNQEKPTKNKRLIKLQAERIDDNKILIKRKISKYKKGVKEDTDVLYYMDLNAETKSNEEKESKYNVDPIEKEQEEKLLHFLKKWANGEMNVVFAKKDQVPENLDKMEKSDTLIIVSDDENNFIRVRSVVMDKNSDKNIDCNIKDSKWIHIVKAIINYRRGHLSDKKLSNSCCKRGQCSLN